MSAYTSNSNQTLKNIKRSFDFFSNIKNSLYQLFELLRSIIRSIFFDNDNKNIVLNIKTRFFNNKNVC